MKLDFESADLEKLADALALKVAERLRPLLQAKTTGQEGDKIFSVGTLAEYLGVSEDCVYEMVSLKQIPYFKVGRLNKFRKTDIDRWTLETYTPALNGIPKHLKRRVKNEET